MLLSEAHAELQSFVWRETSFSVLHQTFVERVSCFILSLPVHLRPLHLVVFLMLIRVSPAVHLLRLDVYWLVPAL